MTEECKHTNLTASLETVTNYRFQVNVLRCSSCRKAIGVLEYNNIGAMVGTLANKLNLTL